VLNENLRKYKQKNTHPCHQASGFILEQSNYKGDYYQTFKKKLHTAHLVEFPIPWTSKDMIRISVLILHSFSSPFLANMVPCGFGY